MSTFQTHGPYYNTDTLSLFESLAHLTWGWLLAHLYRGAG